MTKQCYIHSSLDVVLCLSLYVYNHVENVLKHIFFYMHNIKVMTKNIDLPIRKLPENTLLNLIMGQPKTRNFCLPDWKPNTMSPYSDITPYNSSPERSGNVTSFSTLLTNKSFLFYLYLWYIDNNHWWK
jgi:hypothetical protein